MLLTTNACLALARLYALCRYVGKVSRDVYIYSFSRCFYPKRLTIEEYNKRLQYATISIGISAYEVM